LFPNVTVLSDRLLNDTFEIKAAFGGVLIVAIDAVSACKLLVRRFLRMANVHQKGGRQHQKVPQKVQTLK
jgi:hypothetical protein